MIVRRGIRTIAIALVVSSAAWSTAVTADRASAAAPVAPGPTSIVQLGDSVVSGEGTLYGYTYDAHTEEWTGGNLDVRWPGPYPDCHVSPDAYGNVVAAYFGAAFEQFACTGATFANGISAPERSDGHELRPAEFGNWATKADLNAAYDAARPDLVLVTFGADDVQFRSIVQSCIENGYAYEFDLADLECVAKNPGGSVRADFIARLPSVLDDHATLVQWIQRRARAAEVPPPKVLFTTYPDPLPRKGARCPDSSWLYPQQVQYLSSLVRRMNAAIVRTIERLDAEGVSVIDLTDAYVPAGVDHRWCTRAPWAYGLSIFHVYEPASFDSQAPFHPTPAGQRAIAAHVVPAAKLLFAS